MSKRSEKMNAWRSDKKNKWYRCLDKHNADFSKFEELLTSLYVAISNQTSTYNPSLVSNLNEYLV